MLSLLLYNQGKESSITKIYSIFYYSHIFFLTFTLDYCFFLYNADLFSTFCIKFSRDIYTSSAIITITKSLRHSTRLRQNGLKSPNIKCTKINLCNFITPTQVPSYSHTRKSMIFQFQMFMKITCFAYSPSATGMPSCLKLVRSNEWGAAGDSPARPNTPNSTAATLRGPHLLRYQ